MTITQWHVPVDDTNYYWYAIFTSFGDAGRQGDDARAAAEALHAARLPPARRHAHNDWGFDAPSSRRQTYTGMGLDINVHDQWAVESQGRIQDRTREHLGTTDKAIIANRRLLLRRSTRCGNGEHAADVARPERAAALRGPVAIDGMGPTDGLADLLAGRRRTPPQRLAAGRPTPRRRCVA